MTHRVLVTAAASHIGREIVRAFAGKTPRSFCVTLMPGGLMAWHKKSMAW